MTQLTEMKETLTEVQQQKADVVTLHEQSREETRHLQDKYQEAARKVRMLEVKMIDLKRHRGGSQSARDVESPLHEDRHGASGEVSAPYPDDRTLGNSPYDPRKASPQQRCGNGSRSPFNSCFTSSSGPALSRPSRGMGLGGNTPLGGLSTSRHGTPLRGPLFSKGSTPARNYSLFNQGSSLRR